MTKPKILAGIDGGGTRSELVLIDADGREIKRIKGGSLQVLRLSEDQIRTNLLELYQSLTTSEREQLIGLGAGLAGALAQKTRDRILPILTEVFDLEQNRVRLISDIEAAHIGAFNDHNGLMIILGTGSVALARNNEKWKIAGGYGFQIGDECSGYDLGRLAMQLMTRHLDGVHDFTTLKDHVCNAVADPSILDDRNTFIRWIYEEQPDFASFAPIFLDLCEQESEYEVYLKERVSILLDHVEVLMDAFSETDQATVNTSLAGGLIKHTYFKTLFTGVLTERFPQIKIQQSQHDSAYGAALAVKHQIY